MAGEWTQISFGEVKLEELAGSTVQVEALIEPHAIMEGHVRHIRTQTGAWCCDLHWLNRCLIRGERLWTRTSTVCYVLELGRQPRVERDEMGNLRLHGSFGVATFFPTAQASLTSVDNLATT